ncbi:helix-turn-helix domain-containing protein [Amycolatopsis sp. NPDC006131]|uniref:helix-turn-helix domain-containing protein n=1 Tax=Amycolatopsis sp. NPDC006131 TaxID=3156731 RepID=UPI0033A996A1
MTTESPKAAAAGAAVSPWLTVQEAAEYARAKPSTVRRACVEFQRSNGKRGLRSYQRTTRGAHLVHRDDLDTWIRGESPGKRRRVPAVA